jgi:SAM-dependent methyltransferase
MNSRPLTFLLAVAILAGARAAVFLARRRGRAFFSAPEGEQWSLRDLLVASFLTLFAELALIRWIAVEVRVFAYFKNLALLLCFVGFGLGCALASKRVRWVTAITSLLGLLLVVRIPLQNGRVLEELSQSLGSAADVEIWSTGNPWHGLSFLTGVLLAGALFLLIVYMFVPLGQVVSRQMNLARSPLSAYSWNLLGSLAGILAFLGVSRMMLPPAYWLGAMLVGFALLQANGRDAMLVGSLVVPMVLLLHNPRKAETSILWTPYQQIQYARFYAANGDLWKGMMFVNHAGYQNIVNLSAPFLSRHPGLVKEALDENPYNLPFRFSVAAPRVLIVGSGTGNDVAGAVRNGSSFVDAVEIDPAILQLGRSEHPERPYDSPRVSVHVTDARAYLKRTSRQYDLILFGLLDSHTQFSDYANMRIDNFVYTEESFREAARHLSPEGVLFVKFQINHPWMAVRLTEMLKATFGKAPVGFFADSSYTSTATCFVISPGRQIETALGADPRLANFVRQNAVPSAKESIALTTDDWPYLYQQGHWIPRTYYSIAVLVILLAIGLYLQIDDARRQPPSLFFFAMGAGFLLLETQVISRLALFFGTTWQVNGIVISALLTALLLANLVVDHWKGRIPQFWIVAALIAGLAVAYWFPMDRLPGSAAMSGLIATAIFAVPVLFAGILFASEFRRADSPAAALGANMLGAVAGGLLENLSLLWGMRVLLLVAMALYALAAIGLRARHGTPIASLG